MPNVTQACFQQESGPNSLLEGMKANQTGSGNTFPDSGKHAERILRSSAVYIVILLRR